MKRRACLCTECGEPFSTSTAHGDFCTTACRKAFNNRRAMRGAELFDLFMCLRYERSLAVHLKVWKLLCRMAAVFRAEDEAQRQGRKSWRPAKDVLERRPYLHGTTITNNAAGVRRS